MKKAIYIWILCLGALFFSQQGMAQRGHREEHHNKFNRKEQRQYHKETSRNYRNYQRDQRVYRGNGGDHRVFARNDRPNYGSYNRGRVMHGPAGHPAFRPVPWGGRSHYAYNRHVYFPDYHCFYDARRHGYVYRNRGHWIFSEAVPAFMVGLNWNNVRLQYLQGVPVTAYPQTYYDTYSNRYPAVSFNLNVNL